MDNKLCQTKVIIDTKSADSAIYSCQIFTYVKTNRFTFYLKSRISASVTETQADTLDRICLCL